MGSKKKSKTKVAPAQVYSPQSTALQDLYSKATAQMANTGGVQGMSMDYLNQNANALNQSNTALGQAGNTFQQALGQYGQANQGYQQGYNALGTAGNALQGAYNGVGKGYGALDEAMAGYRGFMTQDGINPMQDVYRRSISQAFNEDIMPELRGSAAVSGQLGSSRAGIGQGLAGARASQQLQDFSAQLYSEDMNRRLAATQGLSNTGLGYGSLGAQQGAIGNFMNTNAMGYGAMAEGQGNIAQGMGNIGAQQGQLGTAYGDLGGQYGKLSALNSTIPWYALNQYAGILGSPTVLNQGSTSKESGFSIDSPFKFSF